MQPAPVCPRVLSPISRLGRPEPEDVRVPPLAPGMLNAVLPVGLLDREEGAAAAAPVAPADNRFFFPEVVGFGLKRQGVCEDGYK